MNYNVDIIKKENYIVSNWSGGKTTELLIYPKTATYSERNFDFRISAATVEVEESVFTNLPKIKRHLMVTEGKTRLVHKDKYEITLNPFEKDSFMGDWETKSYGKASDFNLMMAEECYGDLEVIHFDGKNEVVVEADKHNEMLKVKECFYCLGGSMNFVVGNEEFCIDEEDLFCISYMSHQRDFNIKLLQDIKEDIKVIRIIVKY